MGKGLVIGLLGVWLTGCASSSWTPPVQGLEEVRRMKDLQNIWTDPDKEFAAAQAQNTIAGWQEYLYRHRAGDKYYDEAMARLDQLLHPDGQIEVSYSDSVAVCGRTQSSSSSPAQSMRENTNTLELVDFDFRGCRMGDVINESALVARGYICAADTIYQRVCRKSDDRIGDISVTTSYHLEKNQFAALNLTFDSDSYSKVVEAFTAKFGPPQEEKQEYIQNRMGASFLNNEAIWRTASGPLEIQQYGSSIKYGHVNIIEPGMVAVVEQRQKDKGVKAAKDL